MRTGAFFLDVSMVLAQQVNEGRKVQFIAQRESRVIL
jgi:hypothetical protein